MLEPTRQPLVPRFINAVGGWMRNLGVPLVPLTPEVLKQQARALTGLSDFGARDFEEPLQVLCHSAEQDAGLSMIGRSVFREQVSDALYASLPEAMVIHTIRDPEPVIASVNSLFYTIHSIVARKVDVERMARANVAFFRHSMEQFIAMRETAPKARCVDVQYSELLREPIGAVQRIYHHFGLRFDAGFEQRLADWLTNRPQHKFGKHEYSLEECGIERRWLHEQFRAYYETFLGGRWPE